MSRRVLVVDDERLIRESLARALEGEGFQVERARGHADAVAKLADATPDLLIVDLKLPDGDGLDVLRRLRAADPRCPAVVITAHGTLERAVEAMKLGASDLVKKPFELDELLAAAHTALRSARLERQLAYHDDRQRRLHDQVVRGESAAMAALWREVEVVAAQPVGLVLLTGESGSGKSLVARELHYRSERAAGPFVELNAAAIPDTLLESELFGFERGAFSDARAPKPGLVEVAERGTLFLDEVGDLAPGPQAKLLGFLESQSFRRLGSTELRAVDVRIVAATHQPLEQRVREQRLRADLYYRLTTLVLRVPALRERRADVLALAHHYLALYAQRFHKRLTAIAPEAARALEAWRWPGNVRELKATLQRAALMHDGEALTLDMLPPELLADPVGEVLADAPAREGTLPTLEEMELRYIRAVYELCGGNKVRAAERLGITRQTLARRLGEAE